MQVNSSTEISSEETTEAPVVVFGEVLYDCFPGGKRVLGGAPFNVAWGLQGFGHRPLLISAVGADEDGLKIQDRFRQWGLNTAHLYTDSKHSTGTVRVEIEDDEPKYEICIPRAWDFIPDRGIAASRVLYHGSLALRSQRSFETFQAIAQRSAGERFFDINLRPPFDSLSVVKTWLHGADWVKLNIDELATMLQCERLEFSRVKESVHAFRKQYGIANVLLTGGSQGAQIIGKVGEYRFMPAPSPNPFLDSVGAGDSFTAYTINGILRSMPFDQIVREASIFAAKVCGIQGATTNDTNFYQI